MEKITTIACLVVAFVAVAAPDLMSVFWVAEV